MKNFTKLVIFAALVLGLFGLSGNSVRKPIHNSLTIQKASAQETQLDSPQISSSGQNSQEVSSEEPSELRSTLATYRCEFIDCEQEARAVYGIGILEVSDPLAGLSDFQSVTSAKRDEQVKALTEVTSLREYKLSQAQLAAGEGAPVSPCESGKCILVVLSRQMTYAYEDGTLLQATAVSTGRRGHNTPVGNFHVYGKTRSQRMSGPGYSLPNVPYILWFSGDYSLHGTYWHSNFGHVMSHGCVNLPTSMAHWFFDWAPIGTPVIIRS